MLLLVPQPLSENNFVHSFVENMETNKHNITPYSSRKSTMEIKKSAEKQMKDLKGCEVLLSIP